MVTTKPWLAVCDAILNGQEDRLLPEDVPWTGSDECMEQSTIPCLTS